MKQKRKRAPGGGRKPSGPFAHMTQSVTIRMPTEMRAELEDAAQKRHRSLSQEILVRLNNSLARERKDAHPAFRALGYLMSQMTMHMLARLGTVVDLMSLPRPALKDPFLFKAIRSGFIRLLDAIEPEGEVESPVAGLTPRDWYEEGTHALFATPEDAGAYAADATLYLLRSPPSPTTAEHLRKAGNETYARVADLIEDNQYAMAHVRRDLGIAMAEPEEPTS